MNSKAKVLLLLSFIANIALVAGYWMNRPATPKAVEEKPAANIASRASNAGRTERNAQVVTVTQDKPLDWRTVESADYVAYIENLRSIGCPEETVRDIIIADINKLYASKIAALYPSPKEVKFWRVEDRKAREEVRERDNKRRELDEEKEALIAELLGVDYDAEMAKWSGRPTEDSWRYGFLSPEKQEQTKALYEKYREMERDLFRTGGGWTAENRAKFMALRAEREAEMAKLLGPEEFEQYQLRNSYTARNMRENLAGFQPTEEEFRQIFQLKKAFDDQFGFTRDGSDDAVREERRLAQEKLDQQLAATLGPERFHEYQIMQDERFRDAYEFTERYNLPRQVAETIHAVRVAAEEERRRIQRDPNLSDTDRTAALRDLAQQTSQVLQPTLGADNWANYQRRDGRWLGELADSRNGRGGRDFRGDRGDRDDRRGR